MNPHKDLITIPTIQDLTRRHFVSSALAAALLIACGGDDDDSASPGGATRVIETPKGPVEVPVAPQRIVVLDPYILQVLDELGAPVVAAATFGDGSRVHVSHQVQDLPSVGAWGSTLDIEAVVAANPDLIIGISEWEEGNYAHLSSIAPTVMVDYVAEDWRKKYLAMAAPAGLGDAARMQLAQIDPRVAELKSAIEQQWPDGLTVTVLRLAPDSVRSYGSRLKNITSIGLLTELDVQLSADAFVNPAESGWLSLGLERLRDVDADVILYYAGGGSAQGDIPAMEQAMTSSPLWRSLAAVQAGRAYSLDAAIWFDAEDLESANLILDDLFTYLT